MPKILKFVKDALAGRNHDEEADARLHAEVAKRRKVEAALLVSEERMLMALNVSYTFF